MNKQQKTRKSQTPGRFLLRLLLTAAWLPLAGTGVAAADVPDPPFSLSAQEPTLPQERQRLSSSEHCDEHKRKFHGGDLAQQQQAMSRELMAYQELVEEALSMRAGAIELMSQVGDKQKRGEALTGGDLKSINQGAADMLAQRAALFRVSLAHECWLGEPEPTDSNAMDIRAKGIAISLSAALVLYDNYLSAISLYRSDAMLRKHLNQSDRGYGLKRGELNRIAASFASAGNRARVRRGIVWYDARGMAGVSEATRNDEGYRYLVQLIEQSPSRQMVRQVRPLQFMGNMLGLFSTLGVDTLFGLEKQGVQVTSMLFGNTVGLVETRHGKLYSSRPVLDNLSSQARAGDILLEKTPFRLTDAFIPGHWGHAAVWVGSEAELRALGIWDHPVVKPHQQAIRDGHGVVEALRSGVMMNTLQNFINVDDIALLRQPGLPDADRAEVILQALRQVGKGYDFNFDVESTDRIVCSELIYHTYFQLKWPTEKHLGRVTISPDNVAVYATGQGPLETVLLYHDGSEIAAERNQAMEKLVQKEVVRLASR